MDRNMDLIVIGAGPAGLSAACAARACGLDVTLIDEQAAPGGQLSAISKPRWRRRYSIPRNAQPGSGS